MYTMIVRNGDVRKNSNKAILCSSDSGEYDWVPVEKLKDWVSEGLLYNAVVDKDTLILKKCYSSSVSKYNERQCCIFVRKCIRCVESCSQDLVLLEDFWDALYQGNRELLKRYTLLVEYNEVVGVLISDSDLDLGYRLLEGSNLKKENIGMYLT